MAAAVRGASSPGDVLSVEGVEMVGVCGNGLCEAGEQQAAWSTDGADGGGCASDCPFRLLLCPVPSGVGSPYLPCGGNGLCLSASGVCNCFQGYSGDDCGSVELSVQLSLCPCLSVSSVHPSIHLSVCLSVCLSMYCSLAPRSIHPYTIPTALRGAQWACEPWMLDAAVRALMSACWRRRAPGVAFS
jgi:EGF-like domain